MQFETVKSFFDRMKTSGKPSPRISFKQISWSVLGGFLGILAIERIGFLLELSGDIQLFLIGSFGASAVLVYGMPRAEFSQPRNVIGGHVVSALVGVTVFKFFGIGSIWAFPLAVSLSIFAQQLTRTIHPPGGATALIAIIGGEKIQDMGYLYIFSPVMIGSVIMVSVAIFINNLTSDSTRHYPVYWW